MATKNIRKTKKKIKKRLLKQLRNIDSKYKIRFTKLNNKSRKGVYVYIKDKKTKRERGYKFQPEYNEQYYVDLYKNKERKKKTDIKKRGKERLSKYKKEIKKTGRIESWIAKGKTESIVESRSLDRNIIKKTYSKMLSPLIRDKQLLNIITLKENIDKIKHRIELVIEVEGDENKYIKLTKVGSTLESVKDVLNKFNNLQDLKKEDIDKLRELGFNIDTSNNINLAEYDKPYIRKRKSTKIKLVFRKSR